MFLMIGEDGDVSKAKTVTGWDRESIAASVLWVIDITDPHRPVWLDSEGKKTPVDKWVLGEKPNDKQ